MLPQVLDASQFTELSLTECGKEKCIPDKEIEFTVKNCHTLHCIIAGKGTFIIGNQQYELKKGQIFYIPPFVKPKYYPDKTDPWTYAWICFDGKFALRYLEAMGISINHPVYTDKKSKLSQMFNELAERYILSGSLNIKCLATVYEIFFEMVQMKRQNETIELSPKESHIKAAKEFIEHNYQFQITVQDIADSLNITSNYLANVFSEILGVSPKQFLTQYRMKQACMLLDTRQYKVKQIGEMVGYKNQLHFSSEFKKTIKMSPLDYMKRKIS